MQAQTTIKQTQLTGEMGAFCITDLTQVMGYTPKYGYLEYQLCTL